MFGPFQKVFEQNGGVIHDSEPVLDITPGSTTTVRTNKASYTCGKLIITAGPWAPKLLHPLGVKIPLQVVFDVAMLNMFKVFLSRKTFRQPTLGCSLTDNNSQNSVHLSFTELYDHFLPPFCLVDSVWTELLSGN